MLPRSLSSFSDTIKPTPITKTCELPDGRQITIETGKLARQADGSVVLKMGNTMILGDLILIGGGYLDNYEDIFLLPQKILPIRCQSNA